jgi:phosphoribosylaminoimidazolecarboxamide formyltransferase/IMP cyclohydrolase
MTSEIIEKIDIGGISLIRAAAKNFSDTTISFRKKINTQNLAQFLEENNGQTSLAFRQNYAKQAFAVSSHYDTLIHRYFASQNPYETFKESYLKVRYCATAKIRTKKASFMVISTKCLTS